jgi:hypothetical protein
MPLQLFAQRTVQINHAVESFDLFPVEPYCNACPLAGFLSQFFGAETLYSAGSEALEVYKFFRCFIVHHESRTPHQTELWIIYHEVPDLFLFLHRRSQRRADMPGCLLFYRTIRSPVSAYASHAHA